MSTYASEVSNDQAIPETDLSSVLVTRGHFTKEAVGNLLRTILGEEQFLRLRDAHVDNRMVFGINPHYLALALGVGMQDETGSTILPKMPPSRPLIALVIPNEDETHDLSGEQDPSNQGRYSPGCLSGKIIHKYDEIVLGHTALACSAHCRYCYRLDLFNRSTGKSLVRPEELRDYVIQHNLRVLQCDSAKLDHSERRHPISEILLSGGDPMILSNNRLYGYLEAAAQAGVDIVRIGTKEIVFRPERFDNNLIETLRIFHRNYPNIRIIFVFHITHPDEFLERTGDGRYTSSSGWPARNKWLTIVEEAILALKQFNFVSLENQTAIIRRVNDDVGALHLLHKELHHKGIKLQYTFQCREIEGHKSFAVPVETSWKIHNESQRGLSGLARSRFVLSTEWGKLEVVGMTNDQSTSTAMASPDTRVSSDSRLPVGCIVFKVHRSPGSAETLGELIIARQNPKALWISGYEDRILYDGRRRQSNCDNSSGSDNDQGRGSDGTDPP
ncbi:hypothetical protein [Bradyrhizobium sp.]|uniref:hypothetical protein n=1 Tax=Bradyrhizobium sp. TaxID=376 RepID=UPI003C5C4F80